MPPVKVSIIIPCYQQGHFLGEAVASVLAQTHAEVEAIVIDDGSTDDTGTVADDLVRRHPARVHYLHQANQGQNVARQRGLEAADGKYCQMLDADDLLEPDAVERCLEVFSAHPDADAVVGNALIVGPDGRQVLSTHTQTAIVPWPAVLKRNPYGVNLGVMMRVNSLRVVGGFHFPRAGCEDWDVWCRMTRCGMKFVPLDAVLGRYRQTGQNHSRQVLNNLLAYLTMLDLAGGEDPRLAQCGRPVAPPVATALRQSYRNGRVFHALGLALGFGLAQGYVDGILGQLTGGVLDDAWCAGQFSEGLQFALGQGGVGADAIPLGRWLKRLRARMAEKKLQPHYPAMRSAMIHTLRARGGSRSALYLAQRLREVLHLPG